MNCNEVRDQMVTLLNRLPKRFLQRTRGIRIAHIGKIGGGT